MPLNINFMYRNCGRMAELVDAQDTKSCGSNTVFTTLEIFFCLLLVDNLLNI